MRTMTSRLALAAVLASCLVGGIAPAFADVDVRVDVTKTKTITVVENISITKTVTIDITVAVGFHDVAEAQALANMRNQNKTLNINIVGEGGTPDDPTNVDFSAVMSGSVNGNSGIVGVNLDSGNNANQGNVVSVGLADSGDVFANAQAEADQLNTNNIIIEGVPPTTPFPTGDASTANQTVYQAIIAAGSLSGNPGVGIVGLNENAGNANNQLNMVAVAAGIDTTADPAEPDVVVALSEAALGQETSNHRVSETGTQKTARIADSLNSNTGGVIGVNQAAGNNANQANIVSVAAFVTP